MSTTVHLGTILGKATTSSTIVVAKERLYLAADGKTIVKEGDARAATLLAAKGHRIPPRWVERLGITEKSLEEVSEPAPSIPPAEIKSRKTRVIEPETR